MIVGTTTYLGKRFVRVRPCVRCPTVNQRDVHLLVSELLSQLGMVIVFDKRHSQTINEKLEVSHYPSVTNPKDVVEIRLSPRKAQHSGSTVFPL